MPNQLQVIEQLVDPSALKPKSEGRIDLYVDAAGEEWELKGTCGGPKILLPEGVTFRTDNPGKEAPAHTVKWLMRGRGIRRNAHITDEAFEEILKEPESVLHWQPKLLDMEPISKEKLLALRRGCRATFYIPVKHSDRKEKGLRCRKCGSIGTFKGVPPPGSKHA